MQFKSKSKPYSTAKKTYNRHPPDGDMRIESRFLQIIIIQKIYFNFTLNLSN